MENRPLISVIMPTLNSDRTIRMALESIRKQDFDQGLIEILVVDGGSSDDTLEIAREFNCKIISNPEVQPEFAKYHGILSASGKYAVFLDSDEVLSNVTSFKNKIELLSNSSVRNVIIGGLKNPGGYPNINYYINSIGDPFSFFMYRVFSEDFYASIINKYKNIQRNDKNIVVHICKNENIPICDGGGHFFDLDFLKDNFNMSSVRIIPKVFYGMVEKTNCFAIFNNDYVLHYSTSSFRTYLKKIQFRIINNIFYKDETAGFSNRNTSNSWFNIKKYLFIPYSLFILPSFLDSIYLFLKYNNPILLLHFVFSFYTVLLIIYYYILKILKIRPRLNKYGK